MLFGWCEAGQCSSICRRAYHTACVYLSSVSIQLLINIPNLMWQYDSCVIGIGELNKKFMDLISLYQSLVAKLDSLESSSGLMDTLEGSQVVAPVIYSTTAGNKKLHCVNCLFPRKKWNNLLTSALLDKLCSASCFSHLSHVQPTELPHKVTSEYHSLSLS